MKQLITILTTFVCSLWLSNVHAQIILEDGGVTLGKQELEYIIGSWPENMQGAAANDRGDRMELLNNALVNKKLAQVAEQLSPEQDGDDYWKYYFVLQNVQRKFILDRYMARLEVPDMSDLAQERYQTQKDKYALVPEKRQSSHILFTCPPGCPRESFREKAAEVLVQLNAGADFSEMASTHSTDPGTKDTGGKMDRWIELRDSGISPRFKEALFEIEAVSGYSNVVDTRFGLHIIRLDAIEDAYYLPYEEVREEIIESLASEYRALSAKEFIASFGATDELRIDGPAMEELFAPYKTVE